MTEWVICTTGLWMQNLNSFLKPYLTVWKVTYFTMPEFINGFNPETTSFCVCLIARFLLTSYFFCPTKMLDNLRMWRIFWPHLLTHLLTKPVYTCLLTYFANNRVDWLNPCILHHKVPRASIISENELVVSITVLCMPCSPHYTAVRIKNCSKSTPVIKVATMRKYDGTTHPSYRLKLKYPLPFSVSYFQLVTQ